MSPIHNRAAKFSSWAVWAIVFVPLFILVITGVTTNPSKELAASVTKSLAIWGWPIACFVCSALGYVQGKVSAFETFKTEDAMLVLDKEEQFKELRKIIAVETLKVVKGRLVTHHRVLLDERHPL